MGIFFEIPSRFFFSAASPLSSWSKIRYLLHINGRRSLMSVHLVESVDVVSVDLVVNCKNLRLLRNGERL